MFYPAPVATLEIDSIRLIVVISQNTQALHLEEVVRCDAIISRSKTNIPRESSMSF